MQLKNWLPSAPMPSFVAESTLGKLTKWLRLAGLDARFDPERPDLRRLKHYAEEENRTVLTRTQRIMHRLAGNQGIFIQCDAPVEQVRQVLTHFDLKRGDLRPLSRCTVCNQPLQPVQKERLPADVPDYVRHHYDRFLFCAQCGRIYWPGTHSARALALIDRWFE